MMALNLPLDEKLAQSINRRRIAEEQRKHRIFNAKERIMGIDIEAVNHQMHENILLKNKEAEAEKYFADEVKKQTVLAELLAEKQDDEIREINKKIDKFRLTEQRPQYRRDYDLYDPDLLKKERPPRTSDTELCPISGLQKLEGEDLNFKERTKKQKEQIKDLLLQQMQEKRMKKFMENKETQDWESMLLNLDKKALQTACAELNNYREDAKRLSSLNKSLAIENTERKMQQKMEEDYEKIKDIKYNFYSNLLTENPSVAHSAFGPHRVVPDRWKGMSKQQIEEYRQGQIQQIIDNKRKEDQKKYETALWHKQLSSQATSMQLEEEEEEKQKRETEKKIAAQNLELLQQQKLQQEHLNKVIYSNIPAEDYFTQFNTTSR